MMKILISIEIHYKYLILKRKSTLIYFFSNNIHEMYLVEKSFI